MESRRPKDLKASLVLMLSSLGHLLFYLRFLYGVCSLGMGFWLIAVESLVESSHAEGPSAQQGKQTTYNTQSTDEQTDSETRMDILVVLLVKSSNAVDATIYQSFKTLDHNLEKRTLWLQTPMYSHITKAFIKNANANIIFLDTFNRHGCVYVSVFFCTTPLPNYFFHAFSKLEGQSPHFR